MYAGDGLLFVDLDDYGEGIEAPDGIDDFPKTLTVETPHGGTHQYYVTSENIENHQEEWGEIRANNQYVVGPGSQLKDCDKDHHDCSLPTEGRYEIIRDCPIATIDWDHIRSLVAVGGESSQKDSRSQQQSRLSPTGKEPDEVIDFSVDDRRQKMFDSKHGERIRALWEGRYSEAGYSDRSTAEAALVSHLGFWMNGNTRIVAGLMDEACEEYPEADVNGPRKWSKAQTIYRERTLKLAKHLHYYQPASEQQSHDDRPIVSWVTENRVFGALLQIEPATTEDLVNHKYVDRGKRQVRNCLSELEKRDIITYKRDGRRTYYEISDDTDQ